MQQQKLNIYPFFKIIRSKINLNKNFQEKAKKNSDNIIIAHQSK